MATPIPMPSSPVPPNFWDLDTQNQIRGLTWWWWFWLFFIDNPEDPVHPRQLMILWSTKNTDSIHVMDYHWQPSQMIQRGEDTLKFDGMTAVWYYDGKEMHDPFILDRSLMTTEWGAGPTDNDARQLFDPGKLIPQSQAPCTFECDGAKFMVHIEQPDRGLIFDLELTPYDPLISTPNFKANRYAGKMGYSIHKIYSMDLAGTLKTGDGSEELHGSAYFQKVMVNAPAAPWFWAILLAEDRSYLDYFLPNIGTTLLRRTVKPASCLDLGFLPFARTIHFYHAPTKTRYRFKRVTLRKKSGEGKLPVFHLDGQDRETGSTIELVLKAYSRAYWRFEQRRKLRTVLYYNEYPVTVERLIVHDRERGRTITKTDLGAIVGNAEYAWGFLA